MDVQCPASASQHTVCGGISAGGRASPGPPVDVKDASVDACHVGVVTDPDCLGPCEPGTTVTLEGIVWNETENGTCLEIFHMSLV